MSQLESQIFELLKNFPPGLLKNKSNYEEWRTPFFSGIVSPVNSAIVNIFVANESSRDQKAIKGELAAFTKKFNQQGKAFSVLVSSDAGDDLNQALTDCQFKNMAAIDCMVLELGNTAPPSTETTPWSIEEYDFSNLDTFKELYQKAYELSKEEVEFYTTNWFLPNRDQMQMYLVWDKTKGIPVSFGSLISLKELPAVGLLNGAATLPEYRNKGIYRALLKQRVEQAKKRGMTHLCLQAMSDTSAPQCEKFGFRTIGNQYFKVR